MNKLSQRPTWINLAQEKSLSLAARGLLWYILSRPKIWDKIRPEPLAAATETGIQQTRKLLAELCAAGILIAPQRIRLENGQFRYTGYRVTESITRRPSHGARDANKQHDSLNENHANTQTGEEKTAANNIPAAAVDDPALLHDLDSGELEMVSEGADTTRLEAARDDAPALPSPSSAPPPPADTPAGQLAALGVHEPQLSEITRAYPPEKIRAALLYTAQQARENPPGYFMDALRHGWYLAAPALMHKRAGADYLSGKYGAIIES